MQRLFIMAILVFVLSACGTLVDNGTGILFKTADPRISVGFRLLPAPPLPTPDNPVVPPTATEVPLLPTVTPTPECLIKVNWNGTEFIYHVPGSAAYNQTIIEPAKGEFYACNEQAAIDAGARKASR